MKQLLRVAACAPFLWALAARAQFVDPSLRWRTLDTEHFSVHFAERYRAQARLAAEVAESVYPRVTGWLKWEPESRTQFVVLDSADFSNGLSTPLPFNYFEIFLSPPDAGELLQNREWLEIVITHEFTHVVHLDKARRAPLVLRRIFGRILWVFPNLLEPRWLLEGLAVYSESDWNRGYGRLGQSQFEGMMRAEAARGLRSLREVNAEGRGFPLNRDYLYGSYFFAFLAERYGPNAIVDYVEDYSDNLVPFRVDSNPVRVTGKPMDALWLEYHEWLRARFAAKAVEPGREPDEGGEAIERAWSLTSPLVTPQGDRWYVQGDGYTLPRLMRSTPRGDVEFIREVEPDTRLAASPRGDLLLAQLEICGNYNVYYDLYRLDPGGGLSRLTRCGRFRFAAPLEDGRIVAIRVVNGRGEVVVLNRDGEIERSLYRTARGEALTGLAARGETVVVTSLVTNLSGARWSLVEIEGGRTQVLVADQAIKHSPRFGDSADEIYFVANYGNVYNVWSWRRRDRQLARWTNAPNGIREISAPAAGAMLVTTIEADGDVLRLRGLSDAPLELRRPVAPAASAPQSPEPEQALPADRPYAPWSSLLPRSWFPAGYAADGAFALGAQTFGQDALGLHAYTLAPLYEFTQRQGLGSASYIYDNRHGLLFNRSMTVDASSVDSQKFTGRDIQAYTIKETGQWVSLWRHLSFATQYYWGLGGALDREISHDLAAGTSTPRDERVLGLVSGVDRRRQQFLSEGPSEGQQLRLFAETSNGLRGAYSGNFYRGDLRAYVPAGRTVFSLRWNEAYSQPEAQPIQLGGSFSEEVAGFDLPVLDQRDFPLRGYRSGEAVLTGHHARLGTIEWRTPLDDVDRHFMVPPVGMNRLSLAVFVDAGAAWSDGASQHYFKSGGIEVLSEVRLGYLLPLQFRVGVAKGFEAPGGTIAYVKLGRSF